VKFRTAAFIASASLAFLSIAWGQDRMPPIPADKMSDAQKKAVADVQSGPFQVAGPLIPLLRDPKLATEVYALAAYFRTDNPLGTRLTELAILLVARDWTQQFEWNSHYSRAVQAGLKPETINAIAEGRRPTGMPEDEEIVYDFCTELRQNKAVSDATYARALRKLGESGVVDLTVLNGTYVTLAMVLNMSRAPVPNPQAPPLRALP